MISNDFKKFKGMLVPLFSSKGQNLNFVFEGNYGTNSGFFN
jgi:hypothetical protein